METTCLPVDSIEYFYGNKDGQGHGHGFGVVEYLAGNSREHPGFGRALTLVRLETGNDVIMATFP